MPVLVAVGCSSSLGLLALDRFLSDSAADSWTVYAAHRSPDPPQLLPHHHHVEWIPLELESLASVKRFAERVPRVDLVWLNAATWDAAAPRVIQLAGQAAWTREAVVNWIAQHYLVHLLADKLASPLSEEERDCVVERARIVWTTSNLHKSVSTLAQIPLFLRAAAPPPPPPAEREEQQNTAASTPATAKQRYAASKAAQLLSAFYWRRHFYLLEQEQEQERGAAVREGQQGERCSSSSTARGSKKTRRRPVDVVAVSPGFVPSTTLSRDSNWFVRWLMRHVVSWFPFAVSVEEGAARIARSLQMMSTCSTTASSTFSGGEAMDPDAAAADDYQQQQRQQQSAPRPNEEEEGDSTRPSQPDSNAAAASTSDSHALEALLRATPPWQILYLSLPSTTPLPGPAPPPISLSQTRSLAGDTHDQNRDRDEGEEEEEAYSEYVVQGGAVGEWAAAARGGGERWDEVERLGILPSREDLDRFAEAEEEAVA